MSGKPHGQRGDTMSPVEINFALPYCRYWRNCRCYGGTMGSRSNLVLVPSADGRQSGYWRTGSATRWSCRHGEQVLPHSSTSCNLPAQDASRSFKIPLFFLYRNTTPLPRCINGHAYHTWHVCYVPICKKSWCGCVGVVRSSFAYHTTTAAAQTHKITLYTYYSYDRGIINIDRRLPRTSPFMVHVHVNTTTRY